MRHFTAILVLITMTLVATSCGSSDELVDGEGNSSPAVTADTFNTDHPCGHGFASGNGNQTVGLSIFHIGGFTDAGPDISKPIDFATSDAWTGNVWIGSNLFSNWCDDVIEEGEPESETTAEYTITEGTLVGSVEGSTATATLTNVVAEPIGFEGEPLEFAELELRNEAWGFFAG